MDDVDSRRRRDLEQGRLQLPRVGEVAAGPPDEPWRVVDRLGQVVGPVQPWVRELVLNDLSPHTVRAYCHALLRWHRVLWFCGVGWDRASEADTATLVSWLRVAPNPQRKAGTVGPGAVNVKTGKPLLGAGYSRSTINGTLSAVFSFYEFHARWGSGPVINPVPAASGRRQAVAHRSPLEARAPFRRARFRQRAVERLPRSVPDQLWDELFARMGCVRDQALLAAYVSSGARASELLGVRGEDLDWAGQRVWVVSKGSRELRMAPLSPQALSLLGRYLDEEGPPPAGTSVWRTRRGIPRRPLTYSALRRVLQRANDGLGTNWTVHDLRHTAAARMAGSGVLTMPAVQAVLGHRDVRTTSRYTMPRVAELCERMQEFHTRPAPPPQSFATAYDAADVEAVFGG